MLYDDLTMKEFEETVNDETIVILPIGVIEEHGDHLPLSTDSLQSERTCTALGERLDALVLPPLRYGVCSSTRNFPGSISISFDTLRSITKEIISEVYRNGIRNIVIISGHAGRSHMVALKQAAEDFLRENAMRIMVLTDYDIIPSLGEEYMPKGDGHAGHAETSRVLSIRPDLVKGTGKEATTIFPDYVVLKHPEQFFPTGVMGGNPATATVEAGEKMNSMIVDRLVELVGNMMRLQISDI